MRNQPGRQDRAPHSIAAKGTRAVVVPEMNAGQLSLEVERLLPAGPRLAQINRVNGEPIPPAEIVARIEELAQDD